MYRLKQYSKNSVFKAIHQNAPSSTAVLVFPHGIEALAIQSAETEGQEPQIQGLLADYRPYLVGVYTPEIRLEDLMADIAAAKTELLLNNDYDETDD